MPKNSTKKKLPVRRLKNKFKKKKKAITKSDITVSKAELNFKKFLKEIGVAVETQFQIDYKFYDFKVKDIDFIIEFHGSYWHGSPELYKFIELNKIQRRTIVNDRFKRILAERRGYKLIYVWEHHFNKDKDAVKTYILEEISKYREILKENI